MRTATKQLTTRPWGWNNQVPCVRCLHILTHIWWLSVSINHLDGKITTNQQCSIPQGTPWEVEVLLFLEKIEPTYWQSKPNIIWRTNHAFVYRFFFVESCSSICLPPKNDYVTCISYILYSTAYRTVLQDGIGFWNHWTTWGTFQKITFSTPHILRSTLYSGIWYFQPAKDGLKRLPHVWLGIWKSITNGT